LSTSHHQKILPKGADAADDGEQEDEIAEVAASGRYNRGEPSRSSSYDFPTLIWILKDIHSSLSK
jgi:hypothetical protein